MDFMQYKYLVNFQPLLTIVKKTKPGQKFQKEKVQKNNHQNFDPIFLLCLFSSMVYSFLSKLTIIFFSNKVLRKFRIELHTPRPPMYKGSSHSCPDSFRDFVSIWIRQNERISSKYKNLSFLLF